VRKCRWLAAFFLLVGLIASPGSSPAGTLSVVTQGPALSLDESPLVFVSSLAVRQCIVRECGRIYDTCVRRQNPNRQPADWIRRHCQSQVSFCHGQCRRQFSGPSGPPGGPPLQPPPDLRRRPDPPRYGNCYWDGSRPFCAGRCRPGFVALKREGCTTGSRVYCCEPMGSTSRY